MKTRRRLVAGLCVALGVAAAAGGAYLIWQAPDCRPVAAHAYYTPLSVTQCVGSAPIRAATSAP